MSSTSTILAACAVLCAVQPVLLLSATAGPADFYIRGQVDFNGNPNTPCIEFQGLISLEDEANVRLNVPGTALVGGSCSPNNTFVSFSWDDNNFMVVLFIKARGALFYLHQVQLYAPDKTLFYHSFSLEDSPLTGANQGVLVCMGPVWMDLPKQKPVEPPVSTTTSTTDPPGITEQTTSTESAVTNGPLTLPTSPTPAGAGITETSTSSITTVTVEAINETLDVDSPPTPQARMWSRAQRNYKAIILSKLSLRYNDNPTTLPPVQVDSCRREPDFAVLLIAAGALAGATVVSAIVVAVRLMPCSCC